MYVTYSDLIQIGIFICALVGLCYTIFKGRRKQPPLLQIMTAVDNLWHVMFSDEIRRSKNRYLQIILSLDIGRPYFLQSGAYIARAKQKNGEFIRLQIFDFLGFTFYCGRSRKGMPYIMPKTYVSLF